MASALIVWFTISGLAYWIPGLGSRAENWWGARFCIALYIVVIVLFVGNVIAGISLSVVAWLLLVPAGFGILAAIYKFTVAGNRLQHVAAASTHPLLVFTIIFFGLVIWRGGVEYLPYVGDEFASWLRFSKQVFLADAYWSDQVQYHLGAYTNGWPLLVVWPNLYFEQFSESRAISIQFFMHLGLLALLFDVVKWLCRSDHKLSSRHSSILAWLLLVLLLFTEASWKLMPTDLLIDRPVLYAILVFFVLGFAGQFDALSRRKIAAYIGIVFCAGYLLKVTILSLGLAAGAIWLSFVIKEVVARSGDGFSASTLFSPRAVSLGASMAAMFLAPLAVAYGSWGTKRTGVSCLAAPQDLATVADGNLLFSAGGADLLLRMGEAAIEYGSLFKFPLTAAAVLLLIFGLTSRRLVPVIIGLALFFVTYGAAMYSAYVFCYGALDSTYLESFQRFIRVPLRVTHFLGIVVAVVMVAAYIGKRANQSGAQQQRSRASRVGWAGLVLIVVTGTVWQAIQVNNSMADTTNRVFQTQDNIQQVKQIYRESAILKEMLNQRGKFYASVSAIEQQSVGAGYDVANYLGIKTYRDSSYFSYQVKRPYKWTPGGPSNTTAASVIAGWQDFDVIWPMKTDPWMRDVLAQLVGPGDCSNEPEKYFIFKESDGKFACVSKASPR